jgi:hypothetical protein
MRQKNGVAMVESVAANPVFSYEDIATKVRCF